ncbi:MAG: SDR family NAD(P)-dependent oxidoreductase, partial [Bacteroidota bacterium]
SGFGKACANAFAADHHRLILTGRRMDRLNDDAALLREKYGIEVMVLNFDVRDRDAVKQAIESIPAGWRNIDILVNNAGLAAGSDPIQDGNMDDWEAMIDTNVKGLLFVTKNVYPLLLQSKCPHIVNIGSIAGKEVYAKGNVYCATKFAVDALTRGMRIDMLSHGIKVSQVAPGAAETEFSLVRFKGDQATADNVYKGFSPLQAEDIAGAVIWITGLPAHVNINDLVIMPTAQASPAYWHKVL